MHYRRRNMLDDKNYNLLNSRKIRGIASLCDFNKKLLTLLINGDEPLDDTLARVQRPHITSRFAELAIRALGRALFAWHFITVVWSINRFIRYFYRAQNKYDAIQQQSLSNDSVYKNFRQFKNEFLCNWGNMIL